MGRVKEVVVPHYEKLRRTFVKKHKRPPSAGEDGLLWEKAGQAAIEATKAQANFIWVATMDSSHFFWTAVGLTKEQAIAGIRKRWDEIIRSIPKNERVDAKLWSEFDTDPFEYYGGWCRILKVGDGYRDCEDFTSRIRS
jgi:hypothetical protein